MKNSNKVNLDLEITLVKIARALFEYVDSQKDVKEIGRLGPVFNAFEDLTANYINETGRQLPGLCYDLGEWAVLKREWLEDSIKKSRDSDGITSEGIQFYRDGSLEDIEYLEKELRIQK